MAARHVSGQKLNPATEREELTAHHHWFCILLKQACGRSPIRSGEHMLQRLWNEPVLLDDRRLVRTLGTEPRTPLVEALRTALAGQGSLPRAENSPIPQGHAAPQH